MQQQTPQQRTSQLTPTPVAQAQGYQNPGWSTQGYQLSFKPTSLANIAKYEQMYRQGVLVNSPVFLHEIYLEEVLDNLLLEVHQKPYSPDSYRKLAKHIKRSLDSVMLLNGNVYTYDQLIQMADNLTRSGYR